MGNTIYCAFCDNVAEHIVRHDRSRAGDSFHGSTPLCSHCEEIYECGQASPNSTIETLGETGGGMTAKEFNQLSSNAKWDEYKTLENVKWACKKCGTIMSDGPHRAPFPRAEVCCGHCDSTLTIRTGGGQSDPFGWIAKVK